VSLGVDHYNNTHKYLYKLLTLCDLSSLFNMRLECYTNTKALRFIKKIKHFFQKSKFSFFIILKVKRIYTTTPLAVRDIL